MDGSMCVWQTSHKRDRSFSLVSLPDQRSKCSAEVESEPVLKLWKILASEHEAENHSATTFCMYISPGFCAWMNHIVKVVQPCSSWDLWLSWKEMMLLLVLSTKRSPCCCFPWAGGWNVVPRDHTLEWRPWCRLPGHADRWLWHSADPQVSRLRQQEGQGQTSPDSHQEHQRGSAT